ncbi:unnamed protein product [Lactuca saligna]|uniref:Uncharacterized protein n=1 Tax=Lactuca saligna TaxID=75948 RepID=A0AA35Y7E2_LACSI|nr:unnamed protein product [Lactuca saligna]
MLEFVIQGKEIIVSVKITRDVLQIKDQPGHPTEISIEQIKKILNKMGYERVFPPTIKKLLPPYFHFHAHCFLICISGRKEGADEISLLNTGAISALVINLDFRFRRNLRK